MNNELYHWKYIKREKVGGKWKYYYDTGSLKKDVVNKLGGDKKEQLNVAKIQLDNAARNYQWSRKARDQAKQTLADTKKKISGEQKVTTAAAEKNLAAVDAYRAKHEEVYEETSDGRTRMRAGKTRKDAEEVSRLFNEYVKANAQMTRASIAYSHLKRDDVRKLQDQVDDAENAVKTSMYKQSVAGDAYREALKAYEDTPLYKLENASKEVKERIDSAKDWISDLFKRSGAPEPKLSSPNHTVITEKIIPEKVITEKVIEQEVIPEKYIYEDKVYDRKRKKR